VVSRIWGCRHIIIIIMITTVLLLYENMNLLHTVDSANDNAVHVIVHFVV